MKRLELAVRARLDEVLAGSGVTTLQYTALTVLARRDGVSAAQLARDSFVTPQSMAEMLRALEQRGLITRAPNPGSKRELLVHLTPAGHELLAEYADATSALERRMTSTMTPSQRDALRTGLTASWTSLRDHPTPDP